MTGREIKDELQAEFDRIAWELDDEEEYFTCQEFAAKYGYHPSSIRVMIERGQITCAVKVGKKWMIPGNAYILVKQYTKKRPVVL